MKFGFTFSIKYCLDNNLDPKQTLIKILDSYAWDSIRLAFYWDIIMPNQTEWELISYQEILVILNNYDIKIVPTIGYRSPRWPERHFPEWVSNLSQTEFEKNLLSYSEKLISALKDNKQIEAWQIENEPFENTWGQNGFDVRKTYQKEISLLKSLDQRPVIISYGYKPWQKTFYDPDFPEDIVGLDFYSKLGIKIKNIPIYMDLYQYPLQTFRFKKDVDFVKSKNKLAWVMELQAEPWDYKFIDLNNKHHIERTISPKRFSKNIQTIKDAGIDKAFVWGVEWWELLDNDYREEFYKVLTQLNE